MHRTTGLPVLTLTMALIGSRGWAQDPAAGFASGTRIRVTATARRLVGRSGTVIAVSPESLTVRFDPSTDIVKGRYVRTVDTITVARRAIDRIDWSRARGSRAGTGALIGLASGAILGGMIGAATYQECTPDPASWGLNCLSHDLGASSREEAAVQGALGGGFLGAGLGVIIGSMMHWERWEEIPRQETRVALRPAFHHGPGLALAIRL